MFSAREVCFLLLCLIIIALPQCDIPSQKITDPIVLHQKYCGSCHALPEPANMPKSIWKKKILPEMAARLGYKYGNYNPLARNSMEENLYIGFSKTYPKEPLIDSTEWQLLHDYIIANAPETMPADTLRSNRNVPLTQFAPINISLNETRLVGITSLRFQARSSEFQISDAYGKSYSWPETTMIAPSFQSPVMYRHETEDALYVTEIGYMNPSQKPLGSFYRITDQDVDTLAKQLHRPVYTKITDLNDDGKQEALICEFGNLTGQVSMLSLDTSAPAKRTLLALPGTIKLDVADLNKDGKKDIVVLASQGREGIYVLYQEDDLQFRTEQVIQMGSEYGSSWFELIDYDSDGHLDIVLVNGDNADYSNFLKPYHGLRIFLNNGQNEFDQKWFYPLYGATQLRCSDYDLDGDIDFAVTAYFPDFENNQEASFVWLENENAEQFTFKSHTLPQARSGRWMVMEDGDYDQDGDVDLILGSYLLPINNGKYQSIIEHWRSEKTDLLVLENKTLD